MLRCLLQLRRGLASATDDGPDRRLSAAAGRRIGCLFVVVALVLTVVVMGALSKALDVAANPRQHARSPRHTNATSIAAAQPPREPFCTTAADPRSKKHKLVSQPATETALPGTWYAVDDGCALGHMAKDVATLSFLALRQPIRGIIFLHPCATKAEWDKAAVLGAAASSASTGSLFQTVLAPLFQAAVNLSHHHQSTAQPLRVHFAADFAATDTLCYDRVLFRSTQWRWFGPIGARESIVASQQYQHSLAQTVGATVDGAAAPADARISYPRSHRRSNEDSAVGQRDRSRIETAECFTARSLHRNRRGRARTRILGLSSRPFAPCGHHNRRARGRVSTRGACHAGRRRQRHSGGVPAVVPLLDLRRACAVGWHSLSIIERRRHTAPPRCLRHVR
jgi:hypothetical protein